MNELQLKESLRKYSNIDTCPIRNVVSRFSGKWSLLVLCVLAENGTTRFNTIGRLIPDISPKVLTDTLKNLECSGLLNRKMYAEIPPRTEYSLTELGKSLIPLIINLISWSLEHNDEIGINSKK